MRLLLSAALLMAASPVMAQDDYEAVAAQAREVDFDRRRPFAGLNEIGALTQEWSVNAFYAVFQGEHPKQTTFWVVRRVMGDRSGAKAVRWADSRTCPAVETVLLAMEEIPPVRPDAIDVGVEAPNLGIVFDGTWHTFWNSSARAGDNNAAVRFEMQGNVNTPFAQWWSEAAPMLAPCWSDVAPAV
jgi:hypothetical protein